MKAAYFLTDYDLSLLRAVSRFININETSEMGGELEQLIRRASTTPVATESVE